MVDPGGNNVTPREYQAFFKVWRDGQLTVRVAYSLCGMTDGAEFTEYQNYLAIMPQGFGDDMLHFNGIGERITWAMNGINGIPPDADKTKYYEIVRWAAQRGLTVTMHWNTDANVDQLLGIWERVNKEFPIAPLRWTIAHLNDASPQTLQRMKALGVGWTVQDAMYNTGADILKREAGDKIGRQPPVVTGSRIGVPIGAGTDAHRVSTYNPFTVLQWFLDGKNASGTLLRGPTETPTRGDALALLHVRQCVGVARRKCAWLARGGQAGRPGGALEGLHDSPGRSDRRHRIGADDGRRQGRVRERTLHGAGRDARSSVEMNSVRAHV